MRQSVFGGDPFSAARKASKESAAKASKDFSSDSPRQPDSPPNLDSAEQRAQLLKPKMPTDVNTTPFECALWTKVQTSLGTRTRYWSWKDSGTEVAGGSWVRDG